MAESLLSHTRSHRSYVHSSVATTLWHFSNKIHVHEKKKMKISSVYQSVSGNVTMHVTCALQGSRTVKWRMYERWNRVITISILCCVRLICSYFHLAIILWLGGGVVWLDRDKFQAIKSLQRLMLWLCDMTVDSHCTMGGIWRRGRNDSEVFFTHEPAEKKQTLQIPFGNNIFHVG